MDPVKQKLKEVGSKRAEQLKRLVAEHGNDVIQEVTLEQVISGMKGIVALLTDTSSLDPEEGIRFRDYSIPELRQHLPKLKDDGEPLPEGLFYLMLLGEIPDRATVDFISRDWARRAADIPGHAFDVINALPKSAHPMIQFNTAILAMSTQSHFRKAYMEGMDKKDYWDPMYEGVNDLISRLPVIAAYIYRRVFHNEKYIDMDPSLDWAGNLAHMMGYDSEEIKRLMRLYMVLHADHEGGNVSAHTTHLVGTALSNPYYSFAAGMNGLAGPLHGMANQEVMVWLEQLIAEIGDNPTKEQIREYAENTLKQGRVIPGYGHAVLRKTDPRFTEQLNFANKYIPEAPLIKLVRNIYEVVPDVLRSTGKVKNPWPNVDAISGSLLTSYGITEHPIYTVLFGVSRSLGVLSSLIWDRIYGQPLERPSSKSLEWYMKKVGFKQ
ncbi:citrate (Si)-synthase [Xiashengella succiniciproducens]|jgi:citrate synthase|uniref:citrate synthase (unknown stereospecificity) n=1 Tax=Xiashengella succiniciproducens TaxID=2949635 RepID=A0A9J6ZRJ9_9BACT|nr:citrate (Si)-synthase [Alkaliflexus sp. Ai-910]URW80287.1 citrate (Si)-synthase [Alkaliflexus sp. Ai-910]HHU00809.1 citrate (Si)-synthase [Bacteroidales bacterium]